MTLVVIPDTHFPFVHKKALRWVLDKVAELKLGRGDHIVQIGDLYDMYAHSKFPRSLSIYTPEEEEDLGRVMATEMWEELKAASPRAHRWQLLGNHDIRPLKRSLERNPESQRAVENEMRRLMTFSGVTTIHDDRQELDLKIGKTPVTCIHGYYTRLGRHCENMMTNIIHGHTHSGGVNFLNTYRNGLLWELDAGFLGDITSKVMTYRKQNWSKWTLGFGLVDELGPRFVPYEWV